MQIPASLLIGDEIESLACAPHWMIQTLEEMWKCHLRPRFQPLRYVLTEIMVDFRTLLLRSPNVCGVFLVVLQPAVHIRGVEPPDGPPLEEESDPVVYPADCTRTGCHGN